MIDQFSAGYFIALFATGFGVMAFIAFVCAKEISMFGKYLREKKLLQSYEEFKHDNKVKKVMFGE